ncbi:MarR family winged helix-turn-helix transcriptional regulator [Arthrobacter sp. NPDC058130]|uniref:MarR family winged helix-turn-helix transcriptional regulator n=1 Tax=Arthrobacter sp. NPDC058130 TaxID=3346353 RepID=UPI0036F13DE6
MTQLQDMYEESRRLSQLLVAVAEQAKANFAQSIAPFGIPVHLARAVLLLDSPAPMRELANGLACDRSYITSLADQLEERGLIARVQGDDRRIKLLALTEAGTTLRDQMSDAVARHSLVLQRLTSEQRAELAPILKTLAGSGATEVARAEC